MTVWEFRQWIEGSIPLWVPLGFVGLLVILAALFSVFGKGGEE